MEYAHYAWLIPVFPLLAFLILTAFGRQAKAFGVYTGIACTLASFILALLVFFGQLGSDAVSYRWNDFQWLKIGNTPIQLGFEVTNLNALMLVIVTLVSLLVNIYSKGYMKEDERITVFFGYISLFTFSMLGLVLSSNLIQLYLFWELVGVCSFLLVGFWFHKPEARAAAKKAFIVTRIGDVGLFIAILLLYWKMPDHNLDFSAIQNAFQGTPAISAGMITAIAILIFVGAAGKSGQFPLHTWLPDAMEGPTPISALIHAATMVAAGVYLVARTYDIFLASDTALLVVAIIGGFTALFAATIGTAQDDIKRILAYSTVSQLGYMMMAMGLGTWGGYTAGLFHLYTHAFFKALLFLGAGSVIHAVHTQNIHEMGGVGKHMKITAWTFGIGTLALSGIAPFSGFWSKDAILAIAYDRNPLLFVVGLLAAFFTAFYMARLFFLVFTGKSRALPQADEDHGHGHAHAHAHVPHESPLSMTFPLMVLAVLAVIAGFVYMPQINGWFGEWLVPSHHEEESFNWIVVILSNLVGIVGIGLGWLVYGKGTIGRDVIPSGIVHVLNRKYFIDELYQAIIVKPLQGIAMVLQLIDDYIIDGLVRLSAWSTIGIGRLGTKAQNGQVQTYGLVTVLGLVILILAFVGRRYIHVG